MDRSAPFMHDIVVTKEGVTRLNIVGQLTQSVSPGY